MALIEFKSYDVPRTREGVMKTQSKIYIFVFFICLIIILDSQLSPTFSENVSSSQFFPVPEALRPRVNFWKDVFTKYSEHTVVIHDREHYDIIYETIDCAAYFGTEEYNQRQKSNLIDKNLDKYQSILTRLHNTGANVEILSDEEKRVAELFSGIHDSNKYITAIDRLRAQSGIKENFLEGLERREKYIERMKKIFRDEGVPEEILALPHVESSFTAHARSKVGAVGIWQFMRSTGRRYLKINRTVDQRLDPLISTRAAARHLRNDYRKLGSWQLAIMAYNHGTNGILRAKHVLRTSDPVEIIQRYRSRSFQFASRNFYPEFLAALEIITSPHAYIPEEKIPPSLQKQNDSIPMFAQKVTNSIQEQQALEKKPVEIAGKNQPIELKQTSTVMVDLKQNSSKPEGKRFALLNSINKMVDIVPEANAQDAASEPKLSPVLDKSGEYFWIQVYHGESIWHYAQWSGVSGDELRKVNKLPKRRDVIIGTSVKIPRPHSYASAFEERRRAYHKSIEGDYFAKYTVAGFTKHTVQNGDNIWYLCNKEYDIPLWLLQKYNTVKPLRNLKIGDEIIIPVVSKIAS